MKIFIPVTHSLLRSRQLTKFMNDYEKLPPRGKRMFENKFGKLLWEAIDKEIIRQSGKKN